MNEPLAPSTRPAAAPPGRRIGVILGVVGLVLVAAAGGIYAGVQIADDDDDGDPVATGTGFFTAATSTTSTTAAIPLSFSAEEIVAAFGDAVWRVETEGCGELWTGTAFAIDDRHLVTNHHVVANSTRPSLVSRSGDTITGRVVGWSERPDVAVIQVDETLPIWLDWAPTDALREGQSLLALGYPVPDTVFTATPGSIMAFQSRSGSREALRTNAALDRGNSGGPALDTQGRVIGVVTEMASNMGGFQLVPLIFTRDALIDLVEDFVESPEEPTVDCSGMVGESFDPGTDNPETWSSGAETYGDHPLLDELWDLCDAGDFVSCDDLWWMAPEDSDYERFGDTCGNRNEPAGWCAEIYGEG